MFTVKRQTRILQQQQLHSFPRSVIWLPLSRSLSSIFFISFTLSRTYSKLAHSLTYSLIRSLSYFMLTFVSFLVLPPSLNYFSLTHWLSLPLIYSLACFLPPLFTHSQARSLACCLPSFFTRLFIHLLAHIPARLLAFSLPSSLTSYQTSLLGCFLFSSLPDPRTRSFACIVADTLSHSFTFSLFFPLSLARPTASFRLHSLTILLACSFTHSLTPLLLPLPPSLTHSLARSRTYSLACFLLPLVTELVIGTGPLLDFSKKVCSLGFIVYPSRDPVVTLIALSRLHTS